MEREADGNEPVRKPERPPTPAGCRKFAKKRLADAMPEVMKALLKQVLGGSLPHLKAVIELTGLDKEVVAPVETRRKGKSLERILLEQWRKDSEAAAAREAVKAAEREAAQAEIAAELAEEDGLAAG